MSANEGENLYGIAIAVLVWMLKATLVFGALVLVVSVLLVGGVSLLRRRRPDSDDVQGGTPAERRHGLR